MVSPSSGELASGEEELVQMSIATAGLPAGRYLQKVLFYNESSIGSDLPDDQFGNTYKTIDITVTDTVNDAPTLDSATSTAVGEVALDWSFNPAGSNPFIGFQIFATLTPENPQKLSTGLYTTSIYERSAVLGGFTPGLTYSFAMRVYSSYGVTGPLSNNIPVKVFGTASENGTVTSTTGQVWMDRNLGASRVATSSTDSAAYGDLYQWGRGTDGHEKRTSSTTSD